MRVLKACMRSFVYLSLVVKPGCFEDIFTFIHFHSLLCVYDLHCVNCSPIQRLVVKLLLLLLYLSPTLNQPPTIFEQPSILAGDVEVYGLSGLRTRSLLAEQYQQDPKEGTSWGTATEMDGFGCALACCDSMVDVAGLGRLAKVLVG